MSDEIRAVRFNEWLQLSEGQPLVFGKTDCTSWPRRAVEFWTGIAIPCPAFSTRAEALALLRDAGGLVPLWERALAASPLVRTDDLDAVRPFDVGIVRAGDESERGCLFAARHVAYWVGDVGIRPFRPAHMVAIWSTP